MVKRPFLLHSLPLALILAASNCPAREYLIGQRAEEDIRATVPMMVIDVEATETLKQNEAKRIPVIYRFHPQISGEVEAAFRSTFVQTRSNFLNAVETRFSSRTLPAETAAGADFQRFVTQFQRQNVLFPVDLNLARAWAQGEADHEIEAALAARLRAIMNRYVRPDTGPEDIWVGSTIRLISLAPNESVTPTLVQERGFNVPKTNFLSTQRAKADLLGSFAAEERAVARYLASFIQPNCSMEHELTRTQRAERTAGLSITDRYEPGQLIVRRGQVIDAKIKAALDQWQEKKALAEMNRSETVAVAAPAPVPQRKTWPLVLGGTGVAIALLLLLWQVARRRHSVSMLPATVPLAALPSGDNAAITASEQAWQSRALQAEQQAERVRAAARSGVLASLAQWMADKMTRKLVNDRSQLLTAHQKAAVEVAELEARLEKVQAPLQERLLAYESRIADLEKELLAKGEENRELIKAKIQIIRKQVEIERDKHRLEFN